MIELALFIQLLVWLAVCAIYLLARSASLFHPLTFYLAFHGLVFVLRPFLVHYADFNRIFHRIGFSPSDDAFVFTLIMSSAALIVFAVAALFNSRLPVPLRSRSLPSFTQTQKISFAITTLLLAPIGLYSAGFATDVLRFGEINLFLERDPVTGIAIFTKGSGYLLESQTMLGALSIMLIWIGRFRWWTFLPLIAFISFRTYLGAARWGFVMVLLSVALLHLYHVGGRWFRLRYVVLAIPAFFLFHVLGRSRIWFRSIVGDTDIEVRPFQGRTFWQTLDNPDFANFDFLAFILSVVPEKSQTYTYFTQYLQLFTEPIPRAWWPEKPIGPPVQLVNLNEFGNFIGFTNSLPGDGWMSLGWIGLIVTMTIAAFILSRLYNWFVRHSHNPDVVLIYCLFIPLSLQWFRGGGISIVRFSLFMLFPVLLWKVLTRLLAGAIRPSTPVAPTSQYLVRQPAGSKSTRPPGGH